jgi:predicted Rdx family selenoprotein
VVDEVGYCSDDIIAGSKLNVVVSHCWLVSHTIAGYARHFLSLKKHLSKQSFATEIEIVGIKDPGVSGNFEIRIGDDKEMIHSAKTAGQGKAESEKEREMIVEFIQEYLDDM